MALSDTYNLDTIRNKTAELVYEKVEELLAGTVDLCRCEICVLDLVAFTLNRVSPRYVTSMLGNLRPNVAAEKRLMVEIELALRAGLRQLKAHPHHT